MPHGVLGIHVLSLWPYTYRPTRGRVYAERCSIVFISESRARLSASVFGTAALLQPLEWTGRRIPYVPPRLHELLESPVPLIAGTTPLPRPNRPENVVRRASTTDGITYAL